MSKPRKCINGHDAAKWGYVWTGTTNDGKERTIRRCRKCRRASRIAEAKARTVGDPAGLSAQAVMRLLDLHLQLEHAMPWQRQGILDEIEATKRKR